MLVQYKIYNWGTSSFSSGQGSFITAALRIRSYDLTIAALRNRLWGYMTFLSQSTVILLCAVIMHGNKVCMTAWVINEIKATLVFSAAVHRTENNTTKGKKSTDGIYCLISRPGAFLSGSGSGCQGNRAPALHKYLNTFFMSCIKWENKGERGTVVSWRLCITAIKSQVINSSGSQQDSWRIKVHYTETDCCVLRRPLDISILIFMLV